jgi:hypothetical protein
LKFKDIIYEEGEIAVSTIGSADIAKGPGDRIGSKKNKKTKMFKKIIPDLSEK